MKQVEPKSSEKINQSAKAEPVEKKKLGSIDIHIKEIDISKPARSVNRMWPNR